MGFEDDMAGKNPAGGSEALIELLEEGRARERAQTRFYRRLAADAEDRGDSGAAERLNALHADEQHHLSRLTARLLELEWSPREHRGSEEAVSFDDWPRRAREREVEEVRWYEEALERDLDEETRRTLEEILESERHHRRELGGKWMPA